MLAKAKICQWCWVSHFGGELKVTGSIPFSLKVSHCCLKSKITQMILSKPTEIILLVKIIHLITYEAR